jgi:hypothetical protein
LKYSMTAITGRIKRLRSRSSIGDLLHIYNIQKHC